MFSAVVRRLFPRHYSVSPYHRVAVLSSQPLVPSMFVHHQPFFAAVERCPYHCCQYGYIDGCSSAFIFSMPFTVHYCLSPLFCPQVCLMPSSVNRLAHLSFILLSFPGASLCYKWSSFVVCIRITLLLTLLRCPVTAYPSCALFHRNQPILFILRLFMLAQTVYGSRADISLSRSSSLISFAYFNHL